MHEEHDPILVPAGRYELLRQREYETCPVLRYAPGLTLMRTPERLSAQAELARVPEFIERWTRIGLSSVPIDHCTGGTGALSPLCRGGSLQSRGWRGPLAR